MLAFACQGLPFWHQKSIQKSCCFMSPCRTSVVRFYDDFMRKLDLGPLQNQAGAEIASKIFKSPQCCQQVHGFCPDVEGFIRDLFLYSSSGQSPWAFWIDVGSHLVSFFYKFWNPFDFISLSIDRQQTVIKTARPKMGGGSVTPHGVFNNWFGVGSMRRSL